MRKGKMLEGGVVAFEVIINSTQNHLDLYSSTTSSLLFSAIFSTRIKREDFSLDLLGVIVNDDDDDDGLFKSNTLENCWKKRR